MQGKRRINQHIRSEKHSLLLSNREVPKKPATRKQIHHGHGRYQHQRYTSRDHKNFKDTEIKRAYQTMTLQLRQAGIITKKHILDNEV